MIAMLEGCFNTLQLVSMRATKLDPSSPAASLKLLRAILNNMVKQVKCMFEFAQAPNWKTTVRELADANLFNPDSAFPLNCVFWLAYLSLEAAAILQSKSTLDNLLLDATEDKKTFKTQLLRLQEIGIKAMRRLLEDCEFFKMLIGLQDLSDQFYFYSLTLTKQLSALLPLVFVAIENPNCSQDAF